MGAIFSANNVILSYLIIVLLFQEVIREGNVALLASPNPFLCTLYLKRICLNHEVECEASITLNGGLFSRLCNSQQAAG